MRSIRKFALLGLAALMVCAAVASAASAVTLQDASTHTALNVNDQVNGSASNTQLVGTFGSTTTTTVTCSSSSFVAKLTANAPTPTGDLQTLTFTGCHNQNGTGCTVTPQNLGWAGAMSFTSLTNLAVVVPSNGGVQISGTGCLPLSITCTFGASQTVNFAWSNTGSQGVVNQAVTSPTCGSATWKGTYVGRTGATVGSGNFLEVV